MNVEKVEMAVRLLQEAVRERAEPTDADWIAFGRAVAFGFQMKPPLRVSAIVCAKLPDASWCAESVLLWEMAGRVGLRG